MSQSLVTGKTPKARASSRGRAKPEDTPTARSVRGARAAPSAAAEGAAPSARTSAGSTRSSRASSPPSPPSPAPNAGGYVFETWLAPPPNRGRSSWCASESWNKEVGGAASGVPPGASSAGCSTESVAKYADARTVGSEWPVRADRPFRVSCAI